MIKLGKNILFFLFFIQFSLFANENNETEYAVKAAMFEGFATYVKWKDNKQDDTSKPFIITIIGETKISNILYSMYTKKQILNRKVIIRTVEKVSEIENPDILFITENCKEDINTIKEYCENKNILTISENIKNAKKGIHINFFITSVGTVNFYVNEKEARKVGIRIGLELLELGVVVE